MSTQPGSDGGFARSMAAALARTVSPGRAMGDHGDPAASPPRLDDPGLGQRLGEGEAMRFRIGQVLGAGGIGRVLLVEDGNLHREIAIKTPLPWQAGDRAAVESFIAEARITASLEHPGIAPVYDLDLSADGQVFYAMRRLHGRPLGTVIGEALATGQRPREIADPNTLVTILLKVCDALSYAHSRGVIHRDLKPDNIMLGSFGEVLLLDWGASSTGADVVGERFGTPVFMSPEQARGEALDARSDIWSLGATLFQALFLRFPLAGDGEVFWERKRRGEIDPPRPDEISSRTRPLLAIALRAMAAAPERRYVSVQAMADDLRAYQSGQAMAAYRGTLAERLGRWHRRWGRMAWTTAAILAVVAGAGWLLWGERLKQVAAWGPPVIQEDFADDSWRARWDDGPVPEFAVREGRVVSTAAYDAVLWTRRAFAGPVAIEFDGEITPGSNPCDLSVAWLDGEPPVPHHGLARNGWVLQAGAYDNSFCGINRIVDGRQELVARSGLRLTPGRVHRIRAEIDGTRLALLVDGTVTAAFEDLFPVQPGHIGIFAYYAGKAFDNVRVYSKGVPERMSPTGIGDDYALAKQFPIAIDRYQRVLVSHPASTLADEAWYKIGYCRQMAGDRDASWQAWAHVAKPPYSDLVACQDLERRFLAGRHDEVLDLLPGVVARSAACRMQCEGLWASWVDRMRAANTFDRLGDYIAIRQRLFPGVGSSVSAYGRALMSLMRCDEAVADCGDDPLTVPDALVHAGRADQAVARFAHMRWMVGSLRWHAGELATTIADQASDNNRSSQIDALAKSGRVAEALRRDGAKPRRELLVAAGDWAALLARPPDGEGDVIARIATGRIAEAAEGRYQQPAKPSCLALLLLGRLTEAERVGGGSNLQTMRLIEVLMAGNRPESLRLRREISEEPIDWMVENSWFGPLVVVPFLSLQDGDRRAWDEALARALERRPRAGQRLWHLAGFLAGRIDERGLLAQPFRAEAEAWLRVGEGLRAEVAGDRAAARLAYLAFQALPLEKRLLDRFQPSPPVERFVAWRVRELAGR